MAPTRRWTVDASEAAGSKVRLDRYLTRQLPDESRSRIQGWIRDGHVAVNDAPTRAGQAIRSGDTITLAEPPAPETSLAAEPIAIGIVHCDDHLAVVDKPAGLVTHAGAGVRSGTLVNALLHHLGPIEAGDAERPGIVHRLDRLTSGLMVVARTPSAHRALAAQFRNREVRKSYVALVYGTPSPRAGTIDVALGRDPKQRRKISVRAVRRRRAVTHYAVRRVLGPFALVDVRIETGRTHQIRVHLAHVGHPVVGDTTYGGERSRAVAQGELRHAAAALDRYFLHASRLEFRHPGTGVVLAFESRLPEELERFLACVEGEIGAGEPSQTSRAPRP